MTEWTFKGPKSIFWLSTNAGQFAVMFVALAELASIFFGKARKHFIKGAKANNFILSHKLPYRGTTTPQSVSAGGSVRTASAVSGGGDAAGGDPPTDTSPLVVGGPADPVAKAP